MRIYSARRTEQIDAKFDAIEQDMWRYIVHMLEVFQP